MVVLNKALLQEAKDCAFEMPCEGSEQGVKQKIRWTDINGRTLQTKSGHLPSNRMLALHATHAIRVAVGKGWCERGEVRVPPLSEVDEKILDQYLVSQSASSGSQGPEEGEGGSGADEGDAPSRAPTLSTSGSSEAL